MHFLAALILAAGAEPTVFELTAERVVHDGAKHRAYAEGNAELVTSNAAIHADRITWDRDTQSATAIGRVAVRLTDGELLAVIADVVTVRFGDGDTVREVFINDGKVYGKKGLTPEQLRAITDPDALKKAGETTMLMTANHLVREGQSWRLESLELVPCECDFEKPAWSIRSTDATIDPVDDRGSLWSPVVRVHGVPILWLPWISLPLSNRQTGLLAPKPAYTALNGFAIEQPLFVTLGRSADVTITPGYFGGNGVAGFGVWGPRLLTEFRYAPAAGTSGAASLGLLWDLKPQRSPAVSSAILPGDRARGLRGEAAWQHAQKLSPEWELRVDASVFSDGWYRRDLVSDVLAREAGYLRSTATVFHRGPDHWAGLDVALRQDLTGGYPVFGRSGARVGEPVFGPNPLGRLPALTWAMPQRPVIGRLAFGVLLDFVRLAPLVGPSGDEGTLANEGRADGVSVECLRERLYTLEVTRGCGAQIEPSQGDGQWQPGEREPRERIQLMPALSFAQPLPFATLTASAAWRQGVWLGERSGLATQRGYPVLSARADSELARRFGNGVRHAIAPAVEVRGVPFVVGTDPAPYDEVDAAIPAGTTSQWQAIAEIRQRFTRAGAELLRVDVGQGVQLSGTGPTLGESYAGVATGIGWFTSSATARLDPNTLTLTRVSATASLSDGRGHGGYAAYENLINTGTDRMRRPIDLLFGPTATAGGPFPGRAQTLSAGVGWKLGPFGLRYDALLIDRLDDDDPLAKPKVALYLAQHLIGASYAPACDCFRLEVTATQRAIRATSPQRGLMYGLPDFAATLTISRFGSFGVSR